jgi:hypothetical protein
MFRKLLLSHYMFIVKKYGSSNDNKISNNDFLSECYPNKSNKFRDGLYKDIIGRLDDKVYINSENTYGGILENKEIDSRNKYIDLLINGGVTGIKQYLIKNDGKPTEISSSDIVGLKFFIRLWVPTSQEQIHVFLSSYDNISIKPLVDSLIKELLLDNKFNFIGNGLIKTTTDKRQKEFIKNSNIKEIILISDKSKSSIQGPSAIKGELRLKKLNYFQKNGFKFSAIKSASKKLGFNLAGRNYTIKAVYEKGSGTEKEEKTVYLDSGMDIMNVIPNIILPSNCRDNNSHVDFDEVRDFVSDEIKQILKESKK